MAKPGTKKPKATKAKATDDLDVVRRLVTLYALSGCYDAPRLDEVLTRELSYHLKESPDAVRELRVLAKKLMAAREADEATWKTATVNDRIDRAFEQLDKVGIIALQNAGQTMTAGWGDLHDARLKRSKTRKPKGGTFYHQQDLEQGVEGGGLHLAFGAFVEADAPVG